MTGYPNQMEYRQSKMGWTGSGVFNANMFPLGKPSLRSWPSTYPRLLGLTLAEYIEQRDTLHAARCRLFQKFRIAHRPQAIVCFGESCWPEFKAVFVRTDDGQRANRRFDIFVYEADRVILTPHFSLGSLTPNLAVKCVVKVLKRWNVSLPQ